MAVFTGYRQISGKQDNFISTTEEEVDISINKIHHTATRKGEKEWTLEARSADIVHSKKKAVLEDVSVIFFLKDGTKVYLTAEHGILKYKSNDIEVEGNVVINNENYKLKTEKLKYKHKSRIIFSKVPVEISGGASRLTADSITFDLNTKKTFLIGNVYGIFGGIITL